MAGQLFRCETNQVLHTLCTVCITSFLLVACSFDTSDSNAEHATAESKEATLQQPKTSAQASKSPEDSAQNEIISVFQSAYAQAVSEAKQLQEQIKQFYLDPNQTNLDSLRSQWTETHRSFLIAETSRLLGIIDPSLDETSTGEPIQHSVLSRLDQYPFIAGYLDAVQGYPNSGLIYSELPLDLATLNNEHQFSDTAYVALGFHALEFMIYGDQPQKRLGMLSSARPGQAKIVARRKAYIELLGQQIHDDINRISEAWSSPNGFYWQFINQCARGCIDAVISKLGSQKESNKETGQHIDATTQQQRNELVQDLLTRLRARHQASEDA